MGQAKLRGTKQERELSAIASKEQSQYLHEKENALRWSRLSPKQKAKELESAKLFATMLSLTSF